MNTETQNGFTLYELLITVIIIGVVLAIGVPNFAQFTANSRMTSTANDLHSAFLMARSEAARAKAAVTICASANPLDANPSCDVNGSLATGWIVFLDDDRDGVNEASDGNISRDAGEALLRSHSAVETGVSVSTPGMMQYFSYAPTGLGRGNVIGTPLSTVVICDERGNADGPGTDSTARAVVVTPFGRSTVVRDKATLTDIITNSGASCP